MEDKKNTLGAFLQNNAWALVIVGSSIVAQWAVFGIRLDNIEARVDRQGTAIMQLQTGLAEVQTQYAALGAKIDGVDSNVDYIRSRIDRIAN